jgi:hypothetical protein
MVKKINTRKLGVVLIGFVSFILICGGGALLLFFFHGTSAVVPKTAAQSEPLQTPTPTLAPLYDPLNGEILSATQYAALKNNMPLAVMMPNDVDARPWQSGINNADVVYEALTEGPVTRFMAIFYADQDNFKVMPVRSTRVYFLDWLLEYNNIIIAHTGYAQTTNPLTNAYAILKDDNVRSLVWDFPFTYDNTCANSTTTPVWDCAYSTTQRLWNDAEQKHGWTASQWTGLPTSLQWEYKSDAPVATPTASTITIPFLYKNDAWQTTWKYDPTNNDYLRFDYQDKPQMDHLSNTQINTKDLVVQEVPFQQTHDEKDRSIQGVIGQGKAYIFEDGNEVQGTWKKASQTAKTFFYDANGNEIQFNRGREWISVIPDTQTITVK